MRDNNQPIWICGHSLGGGLATLAAAYLVFISDIETEAIRGLVTLAQGRVMEPMTAQKLDKRDCFVNRYFRYTNNNDPVPALPPKTLDAYVVTRQGKQKFVKIRYRHGGTPLDFKNGVLSVSKKPEKTVNQRKLRAKKAHKARRYSKRILTNLTTDIQSSLPYLPCK